MELDPINGKRLAPSFEKGDGTKENAYSIFDLDKPDYVDEAAPFYSDKHYQQFTLGLKEGDCRLSTDTSYTDLEMVQEFESSFRLRNEDEIVHVHAADEKDLLDRTYVFKQPHVERDHDVFVYMTEQMIQYD